MSPVDYDAAIEAGGTPEEIGRYLSDMLGGHYDAAIKAGGTPEEIGRYLSTKVSFAPTVESGDEEPVRAEHRSGFRCRRCPTSPHYRRCTSHSIGC